MRSKQVIWLSMGVLAIALAAPARAADSDVKAVKQAATSFYTALNAMFTGELGPMDKVWSHAADVTYMGPTGGFQIGWDQVQAQWQTQADLKLGGKVEPQGMHITVGKDLAVVQNLEQGENTNFHGKPEIVSIRATNVFRKENGQWKMIGHHTDLFSDPQPTSRTTARAN